MSSLKEKLFKIPSERVALTSETILMSYGDIKKMTKTNSAKIVDLFQLNLKFVFKKGLIETNHLLI